MAARQHSATSLQRYASARPADQDPFNGSTSRDYCNSFWGTGDDGSNILFARMRGASKTTDELVNFWNERALIEEEYAFKLAKLAKAPIGADEIGELRTSLDTLRLETEKQAENHAELGRQIREELEAPTAQFHAKQVNHRRNQQAFVEKKFKAKQTQEAYVAKAKEKYDADCVRINSYSQQSGYMTGKDLDRITMKLQRARQTVEANEKDLAGFTKSLLEVLPEWEAEWKNFCDSCQDLEEERLDFMKDVIWAYANDISTVCVADDSSCEHIRTALDQLDPAADVENFVNVYGTGNAILQPADFVPFSGLHNPSQAPAPKIRLANFERISNRPPVQYQDDPGQAPNQPPVTQAPVAAPVPNGVTATSGTSGTTHHGGTSQQGGSSRPATNGHPTSIRRSSPPPTHPPSMPPPPAPAPAPSTPAQQTSVRTTIRHSTPLPLVPPGAPNVVPPLPTNQPHQQPSRDPEPQNPGSGSGNTSSTNHILFYVKALYDYTATIEEEFDFQAGDVIAVTATPDDGWWSGELLDEARRVEGRHVFPSNFVCLF